MTYHHSTKQSLLLLVTAAALAIAVPARADEGGSNKDDRYSYWSISFLGGMLTPRTDFAQSFKRSLIAGGRLGWTSKMGLGLDVTADYSPLPRKSVDEMTSYETAFGVATAAPRFTLRWRALRLWISGGAGIAAERTRMLYRNDSQWVKTKYGLAASGGAGLELHLLSNGGLVVAADYTKVYRYLVEPIHYKFYNLRGGLVFVFR